MHEAERAKEVLTDLPEWVKRSEVVPTEDHSGTPALVISLYLEPAYLTNGHALNRLSSLVHEKLMNAGIDLWPYVRFEDVTETAA